MKGKPDLRIPSEQGRKNYDRIKKDCGCQFGKPCLHNKKKWKPEDILRNEG